MCTHSAVLWHHSKSSPYLHMQVFAPYGGARTPTYIPHVFFSFVSSHLDSSWVRASRSMRYCCFWAHKFLFLLLGQVHVKISLSFPKQGLLSISHLHRSSFPKAKALVFWKPTTSLLVVLVADVVQRSPMLNSVPWTQVVYKCILTKKKKKITVLLLTGSLFLQQFIFVPQHNSATLL